jgi:3',5'-cyclic AMP phosphodiesterase CpdA
MLTADDPRSIAVLADLHLSERASGTAKQLHRAESRFERALASLREHAPDAVYVLGDAYHAAGGQPVERFEAARRTLDAPVRVVPGNHDVSVAAFRERYPADTYPQTDTVGGLRVGRLDTTTRGAVTVPPDVDIALTHYPLPTTVRANRERCEAIDPDIGATTAAGAETAADGLADDPPALVCSAHLHVPLVTRAARWIELSAPPLCTYPQGYLRLDVGPEGTAVTFVPVGTTAELARACRARAAASPTDAALAASSAWTFLGAPREIYTRL